MNKFRNVHAVTILLLITLYISGWILGAAYHGIKIWEVQLSGTINNDGHRKDKLHTGMAALSKVQGKNERMADGKLYGRTGGAKKKRAITARGN